MSRGSWRTRRASSAGSSSGTGPRELVGADTSERSTSTATFAAKADFEAYWYGPEFIDFRTIYQSYYQVPVLYTWADLVIEGGIGEEPTVITGAPQEGDTV